MDSNLTLAKNQLTRNENLLKDLEESNNELQDRYALSKLYNKSVTQFALRVRSQQITKLRK